VVTALHQSRRLPPGADDDVAGFVVQYVPTAALDDTPSGGQQIGVEEGLELAVEELGEDRCALIIGRRPTSG
jgi:hypothetical protein